MIVVVCKNGKITYHDLTPAEFIDKMYRREFDFIPDEVMVVVFK